MCLATDPVVMRSKPATDIYVTKCIATALFKYTFIRKCLNGMCGGGGGVGGRTEGRGHKKRGDGRGNRRRVDGRRHKGH